MQNIGAYGVEIEQLVRLTSKPSHSETGELTRRLSATPTASFGYRESVFKHELKGQIHHHLSVTFRLDKTPTFHTRYGGYSAKRLAEMGITDDKLSIRAISNAVMQN